MTDREGGRHIHLSQNRGIEPKVGRGISNASMHCNVGIIAVPDSIVIIIYLTIYIPAQQMWQPHQFRQLKVRHTPLPHQQLVCCYTQLYLWIPQCWRLAIVSSYKDYSLGSLVHWNVLPLPMRRECDQISPLWRINLGRSDNHQLD